MSEWLSLYLAFAETALLLVVPVLGLLTLFSWFEVQRLWPLRLPLMIALSNTAIGAAATWLAWVELYRGEIGDPPEWYAAATATAVLVLCILPSMATAYLLILETRRRRGR